MVSDGEHWLELFDDVPLLLDALRAAEVRVAVASTTPTVDAARALLRAFGYAPECFAHVEMGGDRRPPARAGLSTTRSATAGAHQRGARRAEGGAALI